MINLRDTYMHCILFIYVQDYMLHGRAAHRAAFIGHIRSVIPAAGTQTTKWPHLHCELWGTLSPAMIFRLR